MEKYTITLADIENASDYIPLEKRQRMIEDIASRSIARVQMTYIPTGETEAKPMPDRYQENDLILNRLLMAVLVKEYLHWQLKDVEVGDEIPLMSVEAYDRLAASHLLGQIESMKADKTARDKAFSLLTDYREFRVSVFREVQVMLDHQNDVVWRVIDAFNGLMKETVKGSMAELMTAKEETEEIPESVEEKRQKAIETLDDAIAKSREYRKRLEEEKEKLIKRMAEEKE